MRRIIKKRGFTLIEILVAVGISSLLSLSVAWILITSLRSNSVIWKQLSAQTDGRKTLQEITDVVRPAEDSSIGSYPIVTAGTTELTVYSNIDSDSLRERVRFWLDGTTLKKGVIKPSGNPLVYNPASEQVTEIAHFVVNIQHATPVFLYYGESLTGIETPLTDPPTLTDIRVVKVQLEIEENPDETPVPLHVEATVAIRNLKNN